MTLRDLLDTLRNGILRDTSDRVAGDSDQLWSDTTLTRYINEAQNRFARRSLCIRDATSTISQFRTVPGQSNYVLDPTIVSVQSIRNMGNGKWTQSDVGMVFVVDAAGSIPVYPSERDLVRTSHEMRRTRGPSWCDYDSNVGWNPTPATAFGVPFMWETDETTSEISGSSGVVNVTLSPIPDGRAANCVMQMRTARIPQQPLTVDNLDAVLEIPQDYHLNILDYAAYLALRIDDHEAGDPVRAAEYQQSFDRHIEEARTEIDRKRFAPAQFAFGRNGFSYSGN